MYASAYEDSIVALLGVDAIGNGPISVTESEPKVTNGYMGDGIDVMAQSYYGDAMVGLADVNASFNRGVGIHVDAVASSEYGEAMIGGMLIMADGNQYDGLQLMASSYAPASTYIVLAGVEANDSVYGSGIYAQLMGNGDSAAALQGITANNNAQKGVWLDLNSYGYDGDAHAWVGDSALADMNDHMGGWDTDLFDFIVPMMPEGGVEASGNGEAGVRIEADASGEEGSVWVDVDGVRALSNGTDPENDDNAGVAILANAWGDVDVMVDDTYVAMNEGNGLRIVANSSSEVRVDVSDVTATENYNGVKAIVDAWGPVSLSFADMNVSGNDNNGLHVNASSWPGSIDLDVDEVISSGNGNHGIRANLDAYGLVDASFTQNELIGNTVNGLSLVMDSDTESRLFGEYNVMSLNGEDGMKVDTSAPSGHRFYDFGGGVYGSAGMNSIYGNGAYDVERSGAGQFYIMNSYWGGSAPVYGVDYIGNNMQVGGWLAVDPNAAP